MTQLTRRNVLLLAVFMAAATTFVAYLFLTKQPVQALSGDGTPATQTMVVVARQEIRPLQLLRPEWFTVKKAKADGVPHDAITSPADLKDRVALVTMTPGQIVTERQVAEKGPGLGMAYTVKPPYRAVTVAVDQIVGVAGFAKPGNHVDVLATFDTDHGYVARTVLQDVEILAYGADQQPQEVDPDSDKTSKAEIKTTATLAVLPGEAEKLVLAETRGKLRLALRPVDDSTYRNRTGVKEVAVVGIAPTPKNQPATTTITKTAPETRTYREERYSREVETSPTPPPVLPPVSYSTSAPAPVRKPDPVHAITVIRGTATEVVKFKKVRRPKPSEAAAAGDAQVTTE